MKRAFFVAAALVLGMTAGIAQSDPIAARQKLMSNVSDGGGVIFNMSRGNRPFDLNAAKAALTMVNTSFKTFGTFFAEPPKAGQKTNAYPKIWTEMNDFQAMIKKVEADSAAAIMAVTDEASFKLEAPKIGQSCGGCHGTDKYAPSLRELAQQPK